MVNTIILSSLGDTAFWLQFVSMNCDVQLSPIDAQGLC